MNRTYLGGHWFEGKPYQAGVYGTQNSPPPQWCNGSQVWPAGWLAPQCCVSGMSSFTPTRVTLTLSHTGQGWSYTRDADLFQEIGGNVLALFWPDPLLGHKYEVRLACSDALNSISNALCLPAPAGLTRLRQPLPEPYRYTLVGNATLQNPVTGICTAGVRVLCQFFGPVKPTVPIPPVSP